MSDICLACQEAEGDARTALYENGCTECWYRAMAHSRAAHMAMGGSPNELHALIRTRFEDKASIHDARIRIWHWIRKIDPKY